MKRLKLWWLKRRLEAKVLKRCQEIAFALDFLTYLAYEDEIVQIVRFEVYKDHPELNPDKGQKWKTFQSLMWIVLVVGGLIQ